MPEQSASRVVAAGAALGFAIVVFAATLWGAIGRAFHRWLGLPCVEDFLPGRSFVVGLAVVNLLFVITLLTLVLDVTSLMNGPLTGLKIALALPLLGVVLTVAAVVAVVAAIRQWKSRMGTRAARVRYASVIVVALLFIWSLGWRL